MWRWRRKQRAVRSEVSLPMYVLKFVYFILHVNRSLDTADVTELASFFPLFLQVDGRDFTSHRADTPMKWKARRGRKSNQ